MDYIFFLYGLAFILLGVVSLILHKGKPSGIPWIWLSAFGFLHGINEWIDMAKFLVPDHPVMAWIGNILMTLSYLALLGFGRKALPAKTAPYLLILLLLLFIAAARYYSDEIPQLVRYLIGFPAAALSALLLWRRSHALFCRNLKIAALGMGLYALASGLIVPAGAVFLSPYLNYASFSELFGFPVQLARMVLALSIAHGVWSHYLIQQNFESDFTTPIYPREAKKLLLFLCTACLGGFFLINMMGERKETMMVKELFTRSAILSKAISAPAIASLTGTQKDIGTPAYEDLKKWLADLTIASRFTYLMTIRHGNVYFLADSEKADSANCSPAGQEYKEIIKPFFAALQTNKPFVIGPETDRWGTWITTVMPMGNVLSDGRAVYLATDIDYSEWKSEIAFSRQLGLIITLLACLIIIYFFTTSNKIFLINARLNAERNLFIGGPVIVIKWNVSGNRWRINYVSANIHAHLQIGPDDAIKKENFFRNDIHPDDFSVFLEGLEKLRNGASEFERELRFRRRDGSYGWFHAFIIQQTDKYQKWFQGYFTEITSKKAAEENAVYLTTHDILTGFPKITILEEFFTKEKALAKRNGTKVALLYLDIDRFSRINEVLGHTYGNDLILAVAKRLKDTLSDTDSIAREGGDEFILLLPLIEKNDDAAMIAEKILREISLPFLLQEESMSISCSIGIALYPDDGDEIETLMRHADAALAEAKNSGRSTYAFSSKSENEKISQRLIIGNHLYTALENGEFSLHYQPQMDLKSGKITGAEALLRWNNPIIGNISPALFIPVAEENGMIVPIGKWVLEEACRQNKQWQEKGVGNILVAVNMSSIQLKRPEFISIIESILEKTALSAHSLELELTESILADAEDGIIAKLHELRTMGIAISIDDFGTGYSNFLYLKQFNVTKLKIDQSFIASLEDEEDSKAIVETMIQFAKTLRLTTIAEGVETKGQLDLLMHYGCDETQGYYFSKPLPPLEFERYMLSKKY